jgi:glycosyltransferase involved in cell wall biosynthesis
MDDGSTDDTTNILKQCGPRITVFSQPNGGLSRARNALIARATGDLIAFLDSDDIWHPRYLEIQRTLFERYPAAAAFFAEHVNFTGLGSYDWEATQSVSELRVETFEPLSWFRRYQVAPGSFVMSFCCVPKRILEGIGPEPFRLRVAEDCYFCNLLVFSGPVVFASAPPVAAYRIREGSLSSNRLDLAEGEVKAFQLVEEYYKNSTDLRLAAEFGKAFASKRRAYAKILLGAGRISEAHEQLRSSFRHSLRPNSLAKSFALLSLSYLPRQLQPIWPPAGRQA